MLALDGQVFMLDSSEPDAPSALMQQKEHLMNRIRSTATAAVLAISLVACGGSHSDSSEASSSDTLSPEVVAAFGEGEVAELRALLASFGAPVETECVEECGLG